ncbi:MAG: DnaA/Hda family protein [Planctomycetes bacterium]|nr:DnaA/Hda family protein [Planctomycetota bacterium]
MSKDDKEIVSALRAALTERIGQDRFEVWFADGARLELHEQTLVVVVRDRFLLERLRNSFRADLEAVCHDLFGEASRVEFRLDAEAEKSALASRRRDRVSRRDMGPMPDSKQREAASTPPPTNGRRRLSSLAGFVLGDANRVAYSAAHAVVEHPGRLTPLFLFGPSGTGKTHLLEGIASDTRRRRGLRRVVMLSAEQFTSSFLEALRGSGLPSFRRKYRDVEMLLIDDLHFFSGKSATTVELLHTVDSLMREGRQLVFAANRSLSELGSLGNELIGRILGGLVCSIEPADDATRLGIAQRRAADHGARVPEDVLQLIATQVTGDARLIAGAINRLVAASDALSRPIDRGLAESVLSDFFRMTRRVVHLSDIESAICDVFGIDVKSLHSARKSKVLSQPRMLAMWLARKYTRAAYVEIGEYFGRRSHSTVIAAQKQVESWVADGRKIQMGYGDCDVRDAIRRVETRLGTA